MTEQRRHILLSEVDGKPAVCFDTGLDPRSFARTKMSQSLIEKGYIVHPDGSVNPNEIIEAWTASGVCEFGGSMRVWGKPFSGERLDSILYRPAANEAGNQALQAVMHWIKAKMALGNTPSALNPAAAFISPDGSIFLSPINLSNRCLLLEGMEFDYFNCPDLTGMDAVAFCAAAMLYKILTKTLPYADKTTLYQDMREGVFLPPHLAAPGLNKELCALIQSALYLPVNKPRASKKKTADIISGMLSLLSNSSLFVSLSAEERQKQEKEKKSFLFKQNVAVKTKRFAVRNKHPLWVAAVILFFILFVAANIVSGKRSRPTTEGMLSDEVVSGYYDAFSSLDHALMEVCTQGSDSIIKNDINIAVNFYAIAKTRQSYERSTVMPILPARVWKEAGGELPAADVFGVTDLTLEKLTGNEESNEIGYRANYLLWAPNEQAIQRTDTLTLQRDKKKNWRITNIIRIEY